MFTLTELQHRRQQFLSTIDQDALIVLLAAPEYCRNGDVYYPFRQASNFYYLTAFPEPGALALLLPDSKGGRFILFSHIDDPTEVVWTGQRVGLARARKEYGANEAYSIAELEKRLPDYLVNRRLCYYLGDRDYHSKTLACINSHLSRLNIPLTEFPAELINTLSEMRLKKSKAELACMRVAAEISGKAHIRAMQTCCSNQYEYQLEAEWLYAIYQQGCSALAYPSIVAGGANACILHYTRNRSQLRSGDLVLIDAGCEYQCYASDITRTFPVNGRFSPEQKAIYNIVLKAQQAIIALIKPGISWDRLQNTCVNILTQGLVDLGLLKGTVSDLIEQKRYEKFYMHSCSHWLGLDVHDVGSYKLAKKWRSLEPDMVFTVEPGIYIRPAKDVAEKWWNIGIRIEDDIRVTENACEILSQSVPKEMSDIECLMRTS